MMALRNTAHRFVLATVVLLLGVTHAFAEGGPGRYQAIPLTQPNQMGYTVLVIDTQTGELWKWFEGTSGSQGGTGLRYEGAAVPGDTPGEMVARQGFGLPAIQRHRAK